MNASSINHRRTLVIGLDGAAPDLIENWIKAGYLPNLAQLKQRGGFGRLKSVLPVLSPAAWASFATGVNPGRHGIFDFAQRAPNSYQLRLITARDFKSPPLWRLLSEAGKRVGIVNVPMTYPPEPVNGVMVTGLGTPDQQTFTYPPELSQQLRSRGYRVNKFVFYRPGNEAVFLKEVYELTHQVAKTALELFNQEAWDLFMVVFRDSDEMAHFFWKHMDPHHPAHPTSTEAPYTTALLEYYQCLDRLVGEFVEAAGPEVNIIIMSDHGSGPLYKDVFLNEWLRQKDWLATSLRSQPGGWLARWGLTRTNVSRLLHQWGLAKFERSLRSRLGKKINLIPAHSRASFPEAIDWTRTYAYSYGYHGQLFLNLRGREPAGVVETGPAYAEVLTQIKTALSALIDPEDGQPVVSKVFTQEEAFQGPYAKWGADLVVIMRDFSYITRHGYEFGSRPGQIFSRPSTHESGSHRLEGVLLVAGPDFQAHGDLPEYSILDLAPTILHLAGLPVPETMEGQVLVEELVSRFQPIIKLDPAQSKPASDDGTILTPEEENEIIERLQNLGYLG